MQGFATMARKDPNRQKEIARAGGVAAHDPEHPGKRGHEWNSDSARKAGEKGGKARHQTIQITHSNTARVLEASRG